MKTKANLSLTSFVFWTTIFIVNLLILIPVFMTLNQYLYAGIQGLMVLLAIAKLYPYLYRFITKEINK